MGIVEGIKRYFHGASKDEKVHKFEELENIISKSRLELDIAVKGLDLMMSETNDIKKAATTVMSTPDISPDNMAIALDNMKYSDSKLSEYMDGFSHTTKTHKQALDKAVKDMAKLIEENPDIATIIVDVKHDEELEKALEIVMSSYKSGDISRKSAISAYNTAVSGRRTDRSLDGILDKYLKDNTDGISKGVGVSTQGTTSVNTSLFQEISSITSDRVREKRINALSDNIRAEYNEFSTSNNAN